MCNPLHSTKYWFLRTLRSREVPYLDLGNWVHAGGRDYYFNKSGDLTAIASPE